MDLQLAFCDIESIIVTSMVKMHLSGIHRVKPAVYSETLSFLHCCWLGIFSLVHEKGVRDIVRAAKVRMLNQLNPGVDVRNPEKCNSGCKGGKGSQHPIDQTLRSSSSRIEWFCFRAHKFY